MNTIQTLRKLKEINSKFSLEEPTFARLFIEDSSVFLDINGIASVIEIYFDGDIFINQGSSMFKYHYKKNKITIYNTFNREIDSLFSYSGIIEVKDVIITTNTGRTLRVDVSSNQDQDIINKQKTNVEDDTLIIYDEMIPGEPTIPLTPFKRGVFKKQISPNSFNEQGKFQKFEKAYVSDRKPRVRKGYTGTRKRVTPVKKVVKTKIRKDVKGGKY